MNGFLAELKRRKVVRVAAVYAATAFVVLQAADLLAAGLALPTWVFSTITVLVIVGFPVALVLGWALELTPEGVRVTRTASGPEAGEAEPVPSLLGRHTVLVAGALVVLGMGLGTGWFLKPVVVASPDLFAPGPPPIAEKSIAVLPFADLSQAGDQKWFADGLAEEVLTSLARLPELRVVGSGSSFLFAAGTLDDRLVADTLGVAHLVKGSVRRAGDRLRITAQLVRAGDGVQLWSEAYDRDAADLLHVQRDIAEKVAGALDVLLDDQRRERMFLTGTRNVQAFEAFLHGRGIYIAAHARDRNRTLLDANEWFARAMQLDPGFSRAALLHADRYSHMLLDGPDHSDHPFIGYNMISVEQALDSVRSNFAQAAQVAVDPYGRIVAELNLALFSNGWHRMPGLIEQLRGVTASARPSGDDMWTPLVLVLTGGLDLALQRAERSVALDPLAADEWSNLVLVHLAAGDFEQARARLAEGRRTAGDHAYLRDTEFLLLLFARDRQVLLAWLEPLPDRFGLHAAAMGDTATALARAAEYESSLRWPDANLLLVYHLLGDRQRSRDLVRRIDALPAGPAMLARNVWLHGRALTFDLADAPNFSARLAEAGADLNSFRIMPRLSATSSDGGR